MLICILSTLLGTALGALICYICMSPLTMLSGPARLYISVLRGTPIVVLLMITFYVVFGSVDINPIIVAIIAFGMNFAAYVSEMFRAGIESIDKSQREGRWYRDGFHPLQTPPVVRSTSRTTTAWEPPLCRAFPPPSTTLRTTAAAGWRSSSSRNEVELAATVIPLYNQFEF